MFERILITVATIERLKLDRLEPDSHGRQGTRCLARSHCSLTCPSANMSWLSVSGLWQPA